MCNTAVDHYSGNYSDFVITECLTNKNKKCNVLKSDGNMKKQMILVSSFTEGLKWKTQQ